MSYLVDTNVFSEKLKHRPAPEVVEWLRENEALIFVSTITIAEIRRGIERLPDGTRKTEYHRWLSSIGHTMKGSILSFNRAVAHTWGQMQGSLDGQGIKLSPFDGLVAATAIRHGLTVVTRNEKDFRHTSVAILNPFKAD
ncbi:MAG: type II toxin-antitoxin system VapC family toxin [Verrucomicrobiota bacterium]